MLELGAVDWESLTHAYGPAGDVPLTLKALAEGKISASEATDVLSGSIWHQGTVYEATAYAVPFLIEALQNKRVIDKEWLLSLLSNLAAGSSHDAEQGKLWVQRAHDAVCQGIPSYLFLLKSRRPAVRAAAALVLSRFLESARAIVPQVRLYLQREKSHDVRASLMLCLGVLSDSDPETCRVLENALQTRKSDPQRLAAAIGLVYLDKDKSGQKPVTILQETLADPQNFPEAFVFSLWDIDADPGVSLYETIRLMGQERAVAAFIELLGRIEEPIDPLVDFLLDTAFETYRGKTITLEMLTPLQRSALNALLAADAAWDSDQKWETNSVGSLDWQYGLPTSRTEIGQFLRKDSE